MGIFTGRLRAEWDSCIIGLGFFIFHLGHVKAAALAPIFAKSNLAFDFDINRFVALWGDSPFPTAHNQSFYASRHPLVVLVRLICRPLVGLGLDAHLIASSFAALTAGISTLLAHTQIGAIPLGRRR